MLPEDEDISQLALGEDEPDRPGLYHVTMYLPVGNGQAGELEDNTTVKVYRARNTHTAKTRALIDHPGASIVSTEFHNPTREEGAIPEEGEDEYGNPKDEPSDDDGNSEVDL